MLRVFLQSMWRLWGCIKGFSQTVIEGFRRADHRKGAHKNIWSLEKATSLSCKSFTEEKNKSISNYVFSQTVGLLSRNLLDSLTKQCVLQSRLHNPNRLVQPFPGSSSAECCNRRVYLGFKTSLSVSKQSFCRVRFHGPSDLPRRLRF